MISTRPSRRTCLTVLAGLGALSSGASGAQDAFPNRPIRILLPFPPGGAGDTAVRMVTRNWRRPSVRTSSSTTSPVATASSRRSPCSWRRPTATR